MQSAGTQLVLRKGAAAEAIAAVAREAGAAAVYWNEIAQAPHVKVADEVKATLGGIEVAAKSFEGDLLVHPSRIRNKEIRGLRVFTPFWRRVQALGNPSDPLPAPKRLVAAGPEASWTVAGIGASSDRIASAKLRSRRE